MHRQARYPNYDPTQLYQPNALIPFAGGDFVMTPSRAFQLFGEGLITKTKAGMYRRANRDPRREAYVLKALLARHAWCPTDEVADR